MGGSSIQASIGVNRVGARRFGEFMVQEHQLAAGASLAPHRHDAPGLAILLNGRYRGATRQAQHDCTRCQVLFVPEGLEHSEEVARTGARGLLVFPRRQWVEAEDPAGHLFGRFVVRSGERLHRLVAGIAEELRWSGDSDAAVVDELLTSLVAELLQSRGDSKRGCPTWLQSVRVLLDDCYNEDLQLTDIATVVGISRSQLIRRFRSVYGCSIGEYLRWRRTQAAADLLRRSSLPLAEVAVEAGFYDQSHLNRVFGRRFHETPLSYRLGWQA